MTRATTPNWWSLIHADVGSLIWLRSTLAWVARRANSVRSRRRAVGSVFWSWTSWPVPITTVMHRLDQSFLVIVGFLFGCCYGGFFKAICPGLARLAGAAFSSRISVGLHAPGRTVVASRRELRCASGAEH